MASTTSPHESRTDQGSGGIRHGADLPIPTQRQSGRRQTSAATDAPSDDARKRSADVQAAIDIAAGW